MHLAGLWVTLSQITLPIVVDEISFTLQITTNRTGQMNNKVRFTFVIQLYN